MEGRSWNHIFSTSIWKTGDNAFVSTHQSTTQSAIMRKSDSMGGGGWPGPTVSKSAFKSWSNSNSGVQILGGQDRVSMCKMYNVQPGPDSGRQPALDVLAEIQTRSH